MGCCPRPAEVTSNQTLKGKNQSRAPPRSEYQASPPPLQSGEGALFLGETRTANEVRIRENETRSLFDEAYAKGIHEARIREDEARSLSDEAYAKGIQETERGDARHGPRARELAEELMGAAELEVKCAEERREATELEIKRADKARLEKMSIGMNQV